MAAVGQDRIGGGVKRTEERLRHEKIEMIDIGRWGRLQQVEEGLPGFRLLVDMADRQSQLTSAG